MFGLTIKITRVVPTNINEPKSRMSTDRVGIGLRCDWPNHFRMD